MANLSMENNELRSLNCSFGAMDQKLDVTSDLADFPLLTSSPAHHLTSSPAGKHFFRKMSSCTVQPIMSLHEEINRSFGDEMGEDLGNKVKGHLYIYIYIDRIKATQHFEHFSSPM